MKPFERNLIKKKDILKIYVDGASWGNPGPSAYAFIFVKENEILFRDYDYIGKKTNNFAEYTAIIKALEKAVEWTRWKIQVYSDSELVVSQVNKEWRIKNQTLKKLHNEIKDLIGDFEDVKFFHVSRKNEFIKECDKLCSKCLKEHLK
ncbi:MAG: ribonuclease HI family protein [candidate division WOR-3 bacterium]